MAKHLSQLSPQELVAAALQYLAENKLAEYQPYPFQKEFHAAGANNQERMLMAANRVGKTLCAGAEVAFHATGEYPSWWTGWRSTKPILAWVCSVTNEASRDICQKELLGGTGQSLGTGWIPRSRIVGKPSMRQAGIGDVVDTVKVRHKSGGESVIVFKSYDQGWRKFQGTAPHIVWLDEEPDDYSIFTECQTRILTSKGRLLVTFTPLLGETELVRHFVYPKASGIWMRGATWEDVPHLSSEDKARMRAAYPEWEVESRTRGVPMMGEGRVFTVGEDELKIQRFEIPGHYARICGIDFGIEHDGAGVWLAWDRDRDIIFVTDCYKAKGQTAVYHAEAIRRRGQWIPCAWPHDGLNRGKADGKPLKDMFAQHGVNMLAQSARYENDKGGAQAVEPIVIEVLERMKTGRFKVFADLSDWFAEFRSYHRKDGRIVDDRDDMLKATFYAVMMRRYAMPEALIGRSSAAPAMAGLRMT